MEKKIKLVFNKDKDIDIKVFKQKYEAVKTHITRNGEAVFTISADSYVQPYKMLEGTPMLVCIEGHYVKVVDLVEMAQPKDKFIINKYVNAMTGKVLSLPPLIELHWKRDCDGRLC